MSHFLTLADLSHLASRDPPDTPDGRYPYQVQAKATGQTDEADEALHSKLTLLVDSIKSMVGQGPISNDYEKTFKSFLQAVENPDAIDDRKGFFCEALAALCKIPPSSKLAVKANIKVIEQLYNSLPHPPATYLAPFPATPPPQALNGGKFRSADGGGNNVWLPQLGRAGTPYARDVENKNPLPANVLPDPGLVFDTLLRAKPGDFKPHVGGNSSLTFAFASLVTHSLFRTNPANWAINDTSSYLDLSVLYGVSDEQHDMVRNKAEGRGYLWKDAFAEDRLILVPPAASALLVVFSRNHNYIADMILNINERGRWKNPPPEDPKARALQDEEIFQTARLINSGHFMAMIFGDYVAGFLGLPRDGSGWSMNPFDPIKTSDGELLGRGEGNHCSVEFNLLYRWHATTAQKDIEWTEELFGEVFGDSKPFDQLTMGDFRVGVQKAWAKMVDPNPRTRTFGGLTRGAEGSFDDDQIAKILQDASETPAGQYRAQGTPAVLRIVEIMGIIQGRAWGTCSMNEFRKFLGLKTFDTFEEWSSNPEVATAARQLYGHIDNLELYPGLQAEDCMPLGPGSGICCGYTTTRAILGDAVALVRGDRFYTTDYTPANLTTWGFQDCARDPDNGSFGAALPKLLIRHLPRHYTKDSVYGLFPFFLPTVNKTNLTRLGLDKKYTFVRPTPAPAPKIVNTYEGAKFVLEDKTNFGNRYGDDGIVIGKGSGSYVAAQAVLPTYESRQGAMKAFERWTQELIKAKSFTLGDIPGNRIDIVQNVTKILGARWVAEYLVGMPLKTKATPSGLFTPQEVYDQLSDMFTSVYGNSKPEGSWELLQKVQQNVNIWRVVIEHKLKESGSGGFSLLTSLTTYITSFLHPTQAKEPWHTTLTTLAKSTQSSQETISSLLHLAIGIAMPFTKVVAQVVDFYLDDSRATERAEIVKLVARPADDPEAHQLLLGYIREAQRLQPSAPSVQRSVSATASIPSAKDQPAITVQPGDVIIVDLTAASKDVPDPLTVNPRREPSSYLPETFGMDGAIGQWFLEQVVPTVVRSIFALKNLRRAEGVPGRLAGLVISTSGTNAQAYLDSTGNLSNWPGSLMVVYD